MSVRFGFGRNWLDFLDHLDEDRIEEAVRSLREMLEVSAQGGPGPRREGIRGILNPARGIGPRILDFLHPPHGQNSRPRWQKNVLALWKRGAFIADRALS